MERFRQCEITEGRKMLNAISLTFAQAIGSSGRVSECTGMSKPPEIGVGHISQRGFLPGWTLGSLSRAG